MQWTDSPRHASSGEPPLLRPLPPGALPRRGFGGTLPSLFQKLPVALLQFLLSRQAVGVAFAARFSAVGGAWDCASLS